ncbi:DUF2845 domain-containing protein [Alkalisalibacterium limincola]|uniref:DUF2845 domain-containing protein n=1 Tax=Alkalisalibacterium limincola TaxID=2699169 RepID=A0A5C8KQ53_9GAMM|nr:DUF2845 domain-containing protein [Alkalisalibacterium limincola]TXK62030.1 DUF2845 domain-containing protein [Alkalisalibacterium limincola]
MTCRPLSLSVVVLIGLALWPVAEAEAMRCGGRVVSSGDYDFQVRERCGEPHWVETRRELLTQGAYGPLERRQERVIEAWYYDRGANALVQRLVFVDGRLSRTESAGYGPGARTGNCGDVDFSRGATTGEIALRCGQPDSRALRYRDEIRRDSRGNELLRPREVEEWVYAGSGGRLGRLLLFEDGRLQRVSTLPR